ncbi:MAG: hypothetical protein IJJ44_00060 [Solobacterium sp.]|nr:hypothetical protein [Solobacterium sp.]
MSDEKKNVVDFDKLEAELKAKAESFNNRMNELQEKTNAESKYFSDLMLKGYQKRQEAMQKQREKDIEAEAEAAAEAVRAKYREKTKASWADDETRKAYRSFVNDRFFEDQEGK